MRLLVRVVATLILLHCALALAQDATLDRARQLVQSKQYKQAFDLLSPLEQQRAGDPEFDYLLGIAAIDSGQLTRGVFALERVLAVRPDHPQARAEIARAYFLMGENQVARQEFESVKGSKPPAEVNETISRFLDALDARERARHTGAAGYLELTVGTDNNANAATSNGQFAIPALGGAVFTLNPGAGKQSDEFYTLAGGVNGRHGINESVGLIGSASFEQRTNLFLDQFNTGSITLSGGVSVRRETDEYIVAGQAQNFEVGGSRFRQAMGGVGQWRRTLSEADQVSVYAQQTRLIYPQQTDRNANRSVLGGAWAHSYGGAGSPVSFAGAYIGREKEMGANVQFFGHELWGARVGGQMALSDKWTAFLNLSYEDRKYGGVDPLFLINRHDKETQFRASATYALERNWTITPAIAVTDARSNVVVNDYDRWILSVTLRYDFR